MTDTPTEHPTEHQRFREYLPFYLNGTLPLTEQAFVEAYLKRHPQGHAEVEFSRQLQSVVKKAAEHRSHDEGLERLLAQWLREYPGQRRINRIAQTCRAWGLTPAFAVLLVVALVQGLLLTWSLKNHEASHKNTIPRAIDEAAHLRADLKLTIHPTADFGRVMNLLRENGGVIVSGPSESGELWIRIEDQTQREIARRRLLESPLVDHAVPFSAQ